METEKIVELKITARLVYQDKEVATVEKCFGLIDAPEQKDSEIPMRTIDETITEFLGEIEHEARERGYRLTKETLTETTISTILFLVKHTEPTLELNIPLEKLEEKGDGEKTDT